MLSYQQNIHSGFVLLPSGVYQLLHCSFYASQFALASLGIRERFKLINKCFFEIRNTPNFIKIERGFISSITTVKTQPNMMFNYQAKQKLKIFSELYSDLCDTIEIINSTFTTHIVFVLTLLLVTDILSSYSALREFNKASYMFYFSVGTNGSWTVIMYCVKFFLAYSGDSTTNEAEKTLVLVMKAITDANSNIELRNELNFLLTQMNFRKKVLSNKFFDINWRLILTVDILIRY